MQVSWIDWLVVGGYVAVALSVGVLLARRASQSVDEFFLSGRRLPWWIAGTSMVATTFAADTPLVVTGWVRDYGIWKNWLWWCFAIGGVLTAFLFARYWRRLGVMTTAEMSEKRYPGREASVLRGFLGFYHAGISNIIVLSWVLLAAAKISKVLFDIDQVTAVTLACVVAMTYSLLAGFWGVVLTDLLQFAMALCGAICLAVLAWNAVGGIDALTAEVAAGRIDPAILSVMPKPPDEATGLFDPRFWTVSIAAFCVYLGVSWWATQSIEGGTYIVQRIAACRDERHGMLAQLWFMIANYAMRPWPWILVALASLVVLPTETVQAPVAGVVAAVEEGRVELRTDAGESVPLTWETDGDWYPLAQVSVDDVVIPGSTIARTDSERAYPAMMTRYLPVGLLGLVIASLLAALMSTIDTHVILASSFFVNDLYRRFIAPGRDARHYVTAARLGGVVVMLLGGLVAIQSDSISNLFLFFLAFLGGVGPIYVLRWLWWRIRALTEVVAMLASSISTVVITFVDIDWNLGVLSAGGELAPEGRLCVVVAVSTGAALLSILLFRKPDPTALVDFYRTVRPMGAWGPVSDLCPEVAPRREFLPVFLGTVGALAITYGLLFGIGALILDQASSILPHVTAVVIGWVLVRWSLGRLTHREGHRPPPVG